MNNINFTDEDLDKIVNYCIGSNKKNEYKQIGMPLKKFFDNKGKIMNKDTDENQIRVKGKTQPHETFRGHYLFKLIKKYNYDNNFYTIFKDNMFIKTSLLVKNIPIISFNRCIKYLENSKIVLFPLEEYQLHSDLLKNSYEKINIEDKIPKLIWRGSMNGTLNSNWGGTYYMHDVGKHLPKDNIDFFFYMNYSRYRFCYYSYFNNYVDAGFTNKHEFISKSMKYLCKEKMEVEQQCKYRYHIALNGNDWATSLPWQLLNNNVVFIPYPFHYESIYTYDLQPWVHFVPVSNDFIDFERNFNKIHNDMELCKTISNNARNYMLKFLDKKFYELFTKKILDRYVELF